MGWHLFHECTSKKILKSIKEALKELLKEVKIKIFPIITHSKKILDFDRQIGSSLPPWFLLPFALPPLPSTTRRLCRKPCSPLNSSGLNCYGDLKLLNCYKLKLIATEPVNWSAGKRGEGSGEKVLRILLLCVSFSSFSFFFFSFVSHTMISFSSNLALMSSPSLHNHRTVSPGISNIKGIFGLSSNLLIAVSFLRNRTRASKSNPEGKSVLWILWYLLRLKLNKPF